MPPVDRVVSPAPTVPATPSAEWPLDDPCGAAQWTRPLAASTAAVLLPRCDVPAGSVREWMELEAFTRTEYPNGAPAEDSVERLCGDGSYAQAFPSEAGVFVLKGRLQDGRGDGPFALGFEGHDRQLEAAWASGAPDGAWRWDTTADTVGFPVCPSQSGTYRSGAREGAWHFEEFGGLGSMAYDLTFVGGAIEGPVSAHVGWMGNQGVWVGEAHGNERIGTWMFTGEAELEGVSIAETWEAGKILGRVVTPGTCIQVPGAKELCDVAAP